MKTFKDFINVEIKELNEAIKDDFDFIKTVDDLIINLSKTSSNRAIVQKLEKVSEDLEYDITNRNAQSELTSLLAKLPKDKLINKLSDAIEDYIEKI